MQFDSARTPLLWRESVLESLDENGCIVSRNLEPLPSEKGTTRKGFKDFGPPKMAQAKARILP